jgi:hypothetical protein
METTVCNLGSGSQQHGPNFDGLNKHGRKVTNPHFRDLKTTLIRNPRSRKVKSAAGFAANALYAKTGTISKKY